MKKLLRKHCKTIFLFICVLIALIRYLSNPPDIQRPVKDAQQNLPEVPKYGLPKLDVEFQVNDIKVSGHTYEHLFPINKNSLHTLVKDFNRKGALKEKETIIGSTVGNSEVHRLFSDMCIVEAKENPALPSFITNSPKSQCLVKREDIVVYNSSKTVSYKTKDMMEVSLTKSRGPSAPVIKTLALIVNGRDLDSLNKFWKNFMLPMFDFLTKLKISGEKPLLLFHEPPIDHCNTELKKPKLWLWMNSFLHLLNVTLPRDPYWWYTYHSLLPDTCFKKGLVFNPPEYKFDRPKTALKVRDRIKQKFDVDSVQMLKNNVITFLMRRDRVILNREKMLLGALRAGYDIKMLYMEGEVIREQVIQSYCSRVIVGVRGGGLTWAMMQQKNASLIEIAWPSYGLPFKYTTKEMKEMYPHVNTYQLTASIMRTEGWIRWFGARYNDTLVTNNRNIRNVLMQFLDIVGIKKGKPEERMKEISVIPPGEVMVNIRMLLQFVKTFGDHPGMTTLIENLKTASQKSRDVKLKNLVGMLRQKLKPKGLETLNAIHNAIYDMNRFGYRISAEVDVDQFVKLLQSIFPGKPNLKKLKREQYMAQKKKQEQGKSEKELADDVSGAVKFWGGDHEE